MSFEERNAVVAILSSIIAWGLMIAVLGQNTYAGGYDGAAGAQAWARTVLWLILISIAIMIAATILFNIGYALLTGDRNLSAHADERDKGIALRGMRAAQVVMGAGIVLAIVYLAFGGALVMFLNLLLAVCALGNLASEVVKLYHYRRGF